MKLRIKSVICNIRRQKNNQSEQQEGERIQKIEDSVSGLWDNFRHTNICIMGLPEEEKEQEIGDLFEKIKTENFPNLVKEIDIQAQEAQRDQTRWTQWGPLQDTL